MTFAGPPLAKAWVISWTPKKVRTTPAPNSKAATAATVRVRRAAISRYSRLTRPNDIRAEMVNYINEMGVRCEKHHHEVAPSQHELGIAFGTLIEHADAVQVYKYCIHMVAHQYGKTATFMPKPVF